MFYHYTMVDGSVNLKKLAKHLTKYDRNVKDLCRDRLQPSINSACHESDYKIKLEK